MSNVVLINPEIRMVRNEEVADSNFNKFARTYIGSTDLDHGIVAPLRNGSKLCIFVCGHGLIGGPDARKEYFVLNRQLYNGRAVLYAADIHGNTTSIFRELAPHLDSGECADLAWAANADEAEKFITDNLCERPENTMNGEVIWRWSPKTTDYDKWRETIKEATERTVKDHLK
jgi:hypothetical protein